MIDALLDYFAQGILMAVETVVYCYRRVWHCLLRRKHDWYTIGEGEYFEDTFCTTCYARQEKEATHGR